MEYGVRQGSVLSPFLFAVYVDDLARLCLSRKGIYIILYADDILIVARSVCELENVLHICEEELNYLDMAISNKKSCCIRVWPRFSRECVSLCTTSGFAIPWAREVRYLGIFIKAS